MSFRFLTPIHILICNLNKTAKELTQGAKYHRAEVLLDRLRDRGVRLTVELSKRMRRFDWTTDLRYETGRKETGETNGLLRTAREIYEWVEGQIS